MNSQLITAEQVRNLLAYDPESGVFTRKVRTAQCHQIGDRADVDAHGNLTGYRVVGILGCKVLAHRLAWIFVHGAWPQGQIDHMNGQKGDNRIANLRDVSTKKNTQNRLKAIAAKNKTRLVGVYWNEPSHRWRAKIMTNRRTVHLGMFDSEQEAHAAYIAAKRIYHEGCTQ